MDKFNIYEFKGEDRDEEEDGYINYGGDDDEGGDGDNFKTTYEQEVDALASKSIASECPLITVSQNDKVGFYKEMASKSQLEKFQVYINLNAISLTEDDDSNITFSVDDRNKLCKQATLIGSLGVDPYQLNSLAYVLGYWVTSGGRVNSKKEADIDPKKWKKVMDFLNREKINTTGVFPPDVIRYARFVSKLTI